jgi:hypothetical protein
MSDHPPQANDATSAAGAELSRSFTLAMRRWRVRHLLVAADVTLARLKELGVAPPPDNRLARARRLVHRVVSAPDEAGALSGSERERFAAAAHTIFELFFIVRVMDAADTLAPERLAVTLGGRDTPGEDSTTLARDAQFELLAAALLRLGGIRGVHLGEPDVRIPAGQATLGVAVKRISSPKQLRKRVRKAINQIREQEQPGGLVVLGLDSFVKGLSPNEAHAMADETAAHCRQFVKSLRGEDIVLGVLGVAVAFQLNGLEEGAALGLHISTPLQLIAPSEEHRRVFARLAPIGRNIVAGLARETHVLEAMMP